MYLGLTDCVLESAWSLPPKRQHRSQALTLVRAGCQPSCFPSTYESLGAHKSYAARLGFAVTCLADLRAMTAISHKAA